jgi:excisionase family DNA binding protein
MRAASVSTSIPAVVMAAVRCSVLTSDLFWELLISSGIAKDVRRRPKTSADISPRCPQMSLRRPPGLLIVLGMATVTAHQMDRRDPRPTSSPVRVGLCREDVMTAREVADLLSMPVSTVYHLARQGELPARRLGRTWRFLRPRIEELFSA